MWSGVSFSEDLSNVDINKLTKLNTEEIIAALSDKKLNGYYQFSAEDIFDFEEIHESDGKYFTNTEKLGKVSGEWEARDNKLCYKIYITSSKEADEEFDCGAFVYTKYDIVYYFFDIEKQYFYAKSTSSIDLN